MQEKNKCASGSWFALCTALTVQLAAKHHTARQSNACESSWNNIRRAKQTHVILGRAQEFCSFSFNPGGKFVHFPGTATMIKSLHPFALNRCGLFSETHAVPILCDNSSYRIGGDFVGPILRYIKLLSPPPEYIKYP